mmetsp:Transcript_19087/g.59259  ORF Transcript_19087/g.59259 Transcript_19087/m.59259 type:complete len:207 (-) Transcript_19087:20-640(-)
MHQPLAVACFKKWIPNGSSRIHCSTLHCPRAAAACAIVAPLPVTSRKKRVPRSGESRIHWSTWMCPLAAAACAIVRPATSGFFKNAMPSSGTSRNRCSASICPCAAAEYAVPSTAGRISLVVRLTLSASVEDGVSSLRGVDGRSMPCRCIPTLRGPVDLDNRGHAWLRHAKHRPQRSAGLPVGFEDERVDVAFVQWLAPVDADGHQ